MTTPERSDTRAEDERRTAVDDRARSVPAIVPSRALAVRQTCFVHRWDTSTLRCVRCGARVYVEVRIS